MTDDRARVAQLQKRLQDWNPDEKCKYHSFLKGTKHCRYNEQGQLIELHLCGLELSQIPSEVRSFSSLQWLHLSDNQLTSLPATLGHLSSLQWLHLSDNQLASLPATLGHLSSLQWLFLDDNQLASLPVELGHLSSLQWLDLDNNPLLTPPPDIIAQGIPAILAYLRAMQPIKIFYCYAHEDKDLRDQIDKHLGVLKRLGHVSGWYDREIRAGTEWEREIERNLETAHLILLLVSADFVASDYCYGVEMAKALELHRTGKAYVLPVLLRPVDWQGAPFASLQMLPTGAKPITQWKDRDKALEDVAKGTRSVMNTLRSQRS